MGVSGGLQEGDVVALEATTDVDLVDGMRIKGAAITCRCEITGQSGHRPSDAVPWGSVVLFAPALLTARAHAADRHSAEQ